MKTKITAVAAVLVLASASSAIARDDRLMFPVKDGLLKGNVIGCLTAVYDTAALELFEAGAQLFDVVLCSGSVHEIGHVCE